MPSDVYRIASGALFMASGADEWWHWQWPNDQSAGFWVRMCVSQNPLSDQTATLYYLGEAVSWDNSQGIPQTRWVHLSAVNASSFDISMITVT